MTAIIFDMDGVVVDSEPFHLITIKDIFKKYGIGVERKEYTERFAGTGAKYIIQSIFNEHRVKIAPAELNALVRHRTAHYQRLIKGRLKTVAGFKPFLRALGSHSIPTAISSGGHRINVIGSLRAVGIKSREFGAIVTVDTVPQRKPHPQLFLTAARAIGVKPSECVVFEDSVAGVQGAKRAGMKCIALLTTTKRKALKRTRADLIVKDFRDKKILRFLRLGS